MKIVIVDSTIQDRVIGGAQTFLPSLMKGMNECGHEIHFVTGGIPDKRVHNQIIESGVILHTALWNKNSLIEDAAAILAGWVNKLHPDIYLVSVSWDIGWVILPYLDASIATFTIAHSNDNAFYFPAKHYEKFLTRVIGVSHEICKKFESVSAVDRSKIQWIPYGITPSVAVPRRSDKTVLNLVFVGRLEEPDKRISDVIAIIKELEKLEVKYRFRIIGDGSRLEHIKNQLAAEIKQYKVILTGWLKSDQVLGLLQQSEVFILTSSSEGFSISLIEAMANGCCPVVTDIPSGSVQLISNGQNGALLQVGDIQGFAQKLLYLSEHPDELETMRLAAWETGREFSVAKMVDNYLLCFEKGAEMAKLNPRTPVPDFPIMNSCRSKYPRWIRVIKSKMLSLTGNTKQ